MLLDGSEALYLSKPDNIVVDDMGNIFNCDCSGKVKINIGNILSMDSTEQLQNHFKVNSFKNSILDGSYRYCNANVCNHLQSQMINGNSDIFTLSKDDLNFNLRTLYFQFDNSCNLQCPSCRNQKIIHKNNDQTNRIRKILDKVDQLILHSSNNLVIRTMGNGEVFASHTVAPWFLNFNFEKYPIKFYLHTNATLLHKHKDYLLSIANQIDGFEISVDAACKETYERTRVGGKWEDLLAGLQVIRDMRTINPKFRITFSFTVSSRNYIDIGMFSKFAIDQIDTAKIVFYKLQRWWHFSEEQWKLENIFAPSHPKYNNLITVLNDVNFKKLNLQNNFEYLL
jgi:hypothetical protein